jgi:hypothetical protein
VTNEPDNVVLLLLRRIDQKIDRVAEDVHDLKERMSAVEMGLALVNRRLDRLDERVGRSVRRLDLSEAEQP